MRSFEGRVALVTGASRGVGKGIARALGEQGATVYVTGRTSGAGDRTIEAAAQAVKDAGGEGRPIRCDHGDDAQIAAVFAQVRAEVGHLDLLINNVYKIPDPPAWGGGFWDHPIRIWDDQVGIGLRAHYVASWHAAPLLFASREIASRGIATREITGKEPASGPVPAILNVSSPGGQRYHFSASYGAGKAGLDRLTADMAHELRERGVAAVSLYPGIVSTEFIEDSMGKRGMDLRDAQTPLFVGRAAVALLGADDLMARSGKIAWVEDLAEEFDLRDEHGRRPPGYAQRLRD